LHTATSGGAPAFFKLGFFYARCTSILFRGLFGIGRPLPFFDVGAQEIAKRQTADVLLAPLQAKPRRNADHGADGLSVLG